MDSSKTPKLPYSAPKLDVLGDVVNMTAAGSMNTKEGFSWQTGMKV